jgi:tetratricopeptide (TPR) repeat protein
MKTLEATTVSIQSAQHLWEEACANLQQQNYQQAIETLNLVLQANPNDFQSLYCRGLCWFKQKEFQQAIEDFIGALWIDPIYTLAYVLRGASRFYLGFIQEAVEDYETALEIDSACAWAYQQRSCVRAHLKDFEGAQRDIEKAVWLFSEQGHTELPQFLPFPQDIAQKLAKDSILDITPP